MSVKAVVEWAARETNMEADSSANGHTEQFDPNLGAHIDPVQLHRDNLAHALSAEHAALRAKHEGTYTAIELDRRSVANQNTSFA